MGAPSPADKLGNKLGPAQFHLPRGLHFGQGWAEAGAGRKPVRGHEAGAGLNCPQVGGVQCLLGIHKQVRLQEKLTDLYK